MNIADRGKVDAWRLAVAGGTGIHPQRRGRRQASADQWSVFVCLRSGSRLADKEAKAPVAPRFFAAPSRGMKCGVAIPPQSVVGFHAVRVFTFALSH